MSDRPTQPIRRILIPTDFSPASEAAKEKPLKEPKAYAPMPPII